MRYPRSLYTTDKDGRSETAFRDAKQHFGFDAYRVKSRKSITSLRATEFRRSLADEVDLLEVSVSASLGSLQRQRGLRPSRYSLVSSEETHPRYYGSLIYNRNSERWNILRVPKKRRTRRIFILYLNTITRCLSTKQLESYNIVQTLVLISNLCYMSIIYQNYIVIESESQIKQSYSIVGFLSIFTKASRAWGFCLGFLIGCFNAYFCVFLHFCGFLKQKHSLLQRRALK